MSLLALADEGKKPVIMDFLLSKQRENYRKRDGGKVGCRKRSLKIEQERRRERPKPIRTRQGSGDHSAYLMVCTRML